MFETLIQKLQEDKYLTLETTPQHEPSMHNIIERIKKFKLQDNLLYNIYYIVIENKYSIQQQDEYYEKISKRTYESSKKILEEYSWENVTKKYLVPFLEKINGGVYTVKENVVENNKIILVFKI